MTEELREIAACITALGWRETYNSSSVQHYRIDQHLIHVDTKVKLFLTNGESEYLLRPNWKETLRDWTARAKIESVHNS